MKIVVTGGLGFIGRPLTAYLVSRGARVTVVDDLSNGTDEGLPKGVEVVQHDIVDPLPDGVFSETDAVVHLAAMHYIPACDRDPRRCWDVNVTGTRHLVEAISREGARRLVFSSSAAVYAPSREPHQETDKLGPTDVYGRSKLACELMLASLLPTVSVRVLRLFNVFGDGDRTPHLLPALWEQMCAGQREIRVGDLSTERDYVHVSDVVCAFGLSIADATDELFRVTNVGTGVATSGAVMFKTLAGALNVAAQPEVDPARLRPSDRPTLVASVHRYRDELGGAQLDFATAVERLSPLRAAR